MKKTEKHRLTGFELTTFKHFRRCRHIWEK